MANYKIKPVWIKASEVQALTIWDTDRKMERARLAGNLRIVRKEGGIWYNANEINKIFLKNNTYDFNTSSITNKAN